MEKNTGDVKVENRNINPEKYIPPEEKNDMLTQSQEEFDDYAEWYAGLTPEEQEEYHEEVKNFALRNGFYDK